MGKITSLITFNGRTGNVVGRKGRGYGYYLSMYNPNPHNPNTDAQKLVREKFKQLTHFSSKWDSAIQVGLKKQAVGGMTIQNAFFKSNYKAMTGTTVATVGLDFTKAVIAKGMLDLPYNVSAQTAGTDITVSWTDNSDIGNAKANDKMAIMVYNADKDQAATDLAAATRSDHSATVSVSSAWTGDKVELYAFMHGEGDNKELTVSDSLFLGDFTI